MISLISSRKIILDELWNKQIKIKKSYSLELRFQGYIQQNFNTDFRTNINFLFLYLQQVNNRLMFRSRTVSKIITNYKSIAIKTASPILMRILTIKTLELEELILNRWRTLQTTSTPENHLFTNIFKVCFHLYSKIYWILYVIVI